MKIPIRGRIPRDCAECGKSFIHCEVPRSCTNPAVCRFCFQKEFNASIKSHFEIVFRPLLTSGMVASNGKKLVVFIDSEQSREEKTVAVWHEIVHLLHAAGDNSQVEASVEADAVKLAKAFPEILYWVGYSEGVTG